MLSSEEQFCGNRPVTVVTKFLSVLSIFWTDFVEIRYKRHACEFVEHTRVA
jgi:hypothetical protein